MPIEQRLTNIPGNPVANRYSDAVVASGRVAYISGQIGLDADGNLVGPGDLRAQTEQSLRNMANILNELGATWSDVIKYTWFVLDVSQAAIIRDVRDSFLGDAPKPASSLVQVGGLVSPDLLIEVEAVVALP
ncbi:RidA family protein [Actinocrispum wychmicini]|uniref:Enamine deaminase RidA (YjgF/YER057c/UK114 family) n=1 Tax=Actinocrispum wychmicini TaxID=1213861 RepID=A0A4R2JB77_9PSEU|nr:RidA family protein [Actinocrispum wychmicini]TCO55172.1 enamine deaminase RidA (YjgF/YER057c/UK114 family) [Actinocrispum wychmicini]